MRVLTHPAIRTPLRLRLIIQTSLLGSYMRKVPEVQEDSILAPMILNGVHLLYLQVNYVF